MPENKVTLNLDEYNELIYSKNEQVRDEIFKDRMIDLIFDSIKYSEDYKKEPKISFKNDITFTENLILIIKIIYPKLYGRMMNFIKEKMEE